jgi:hypothetical protein
MSQRPVIRKNPVRTTLLIPLKLVVGMVIGSAGIISAAIHSGIDREAAVIAYFFMNRSGTLQSLFFVFRYTIP